MAEETTLPMEEDIQKLPRWAKVAFAARCGRSVLPFLKSSWKDAPQVHVISLTRAIEVAELAAACATAVTTTSVAAAAHDALVDAVENSYPFTDRGSECAC